MPNSVTNLVIASKSVLKALSGENSLVDFNSIIPMPPNLPKTPVGFLEMDLARSMIGGCDKSIYLKKGGIKLLKSENEFEAFIQMLRNYRQHGYICWYDWTHDKWGVCGNAFAAKIFDDDGVSFDSGGDAPHPILRVLAHRYPEEKIEHLWADEDIGRNTGSRIYQHGKVIDVPISDPVGFALKVTSGRLP